jgi:class 3 adenylate cyclase
MTFKVSEFLAELGEEAKEDLRSAVQITESDEFPADKDVIGEGRSWMKLTDVVAVVSDLKNSTALSLKKHPKTTAQLYEAVTGNAVEIVAKFHPDFVDIQGDGLFALYHGDRAYERALCAGITLKTFSAHHLVPAIENWEGRGNDFPETGLKVGMNAGMLAVKKIGVKSRYIEWTEPVWAGRPVNWAFKCAQAADANQLVATKSVFGKFDRNDYVTHSCAHLEGDVPAKLWAPIEVEPLDKYDVPTMILKTLWCDQCGDKFCQAILDGKTDREDVSVSGI